MAVRQREFLFSTNEYNEPEKVTGKSAIALLLVRLILLEPGSDPLRPEMGVGIRDYRYSLDQLKELKKKIEEQVEAFLPDYQDATVALIGTPDKVCNIEIAIGDTVYVYDSSTAPKPIQIADMADIQKIRV